MGVARNDPRQSLLTEFGAELGDDARQSLGPRMQELRRKLGSVDVAANVDGVIVIDGRLRGKLPALAPIRVTPGRHTVRVFKDGYEPSESAVTVKVGETVPVDAKLRPLARAGRLRVEAIGEPGADVFVDGAPVGKAPWEGTVSAGSHLVWLQRGDAGSAPFDVGVVEGRAITERRELMPLGADLRIETTPAGAKIRVDGVVVGQGLWNGRLPVGEHRIDSEEDGYLRSERNLSVTSARSEPVLLRLQADPEHPRWREAQRGRVFLEAHVGRPIAPAFGSDAESSCAAGYCTLPYGILAGARGGYAFPFGLSIEIGGGYLNLHRRVERSRVASFGPPEESTSITYRLTDSLVLAGPFGTVGLGYRLKLDRVFSIGARAHVGVVSMTTQDRVEGTAVANGASAPVIVERAGEPSQSINVFLLPEAHLRMDLGSFHLAVGLSAAVLLLDGPANEHGETYVDRAGADCGQYPAPIRCAPGERFLEGERSYGSFFVLTPGITMGYTL